MTKVKFIDDTTICVVARDGEKFTLKTPLPVAEVEQHRVAKFLANSFENNFTNDKSSMVYFVFCDAQANADFSFSLVGSNRSEDRERIGAKIRQLRENKGIEAKQLAALADIDAANLSRIEQGKYSVGLDILERISNVLGVKVDLI